MTASRFRIELYPDGVLLPCSDCSRAEFGDHRVESFTGFRTVCDRSLTRSVESVIVRNLDDTGIAPENVRESSGGDV
jgi:hypothetical protein